MSYNTRTGEEDDRAKALQEIRKVPIPVTDPVYGQHGPLLEMWNGKKS